MDVNNLNANNPLNRRSREAEPHQAADAATRSDGSRRTEESRQSQAGDEVSLSPEARQLRDIETEAAGHDAFDQKRVDDIRAAIAEGRYHVDPERLAQRFLDLESHLNQ